MSAGRILLVTGPLGAGKSSISQELAAQSPADLSVLLRGDDFRSVIRKGFVRAWKPEAEQQNLTVAKATLAAAMAYSRGGYEVIVDSVAAFWTLPLWQDAARADGCELHHLLLLPDEATTLARARARDPARFVTDTEVVTAMWRRFAAAPFDDVHRLDTSAETADATLARVRQGLAAGRFRRG